MASTPKPARHRLLACIVGVLLTAVSFFVAGTALAQTIVVGGKDFTEQLLIAEMTSQLLRSKGFDVETRAGYNSTRLRKAQEAGIVDLYWEYTGTSLREFNKVTEKLSPADTYARVRQLDAEKGLVWLEPSRVNNTYALAMRRADATARSISTISDLAATIRKGERILFASSLEFYERSDGLRPLEQAYDFQFGPDRVARLSSDRIYQVLRDLQLVDVGLVFATDGRVAEYDFVLLKDDKEFFPNYTMVPVVRQQTLERHPGLPTHLSRLSAILDNDTMAKLNRMVDLDRMRTREVASEFLSTRGLQ